MPTSIDTTLRIFISHSYKDNEFGVKLVEDLHRVLGDESAVWYDAKGGLHGGDTWWLKIVEEITSRNIFIVVLSPDSMASPWVNDEINLAWRQKNSPEGKRIFPLVYRKCKARGDLYTLQMIDFLPPKTYEDAFNELLISLGLSPDMETSKSTRIVNDPDTVLVQQIAPQIKASFAAKDWPDVIRKTNFLLKRAPVAVTSEIYCMQGVAFSAEGQAQQAQEAFDASLALVSDHEQRLTILKNYADLLTSQDQWSEVQRLANEALRLVPNDHGWTTIQRQAKSKVQKTSANPQKTKEQWIEEGIAFYDANRYEEAIATYNHAIILDANDAQVYTHRGDAYRMLKKYQQAIEDFNQAIALDPRNDLAYALRGEAHRMLKDYQRAMQDFDRAIELNPKSAWAHAHRGVTYRLLDYFQRAMQDLNRAIELNPKSAWSYTQRGEVYRLLKDYQGAMQDFDRAIELNPKSADAYAFRGETYREIKNYQRAMQDLNRAIKLNPKYAWAYGSRGRAYSSLKEYERAIQDFDRALELESSMTWAYDEREEVYRLLKKQR